METKIVRIRTATEDTKSLPVRNERYKLVFLAHILIRQLEYVLESQGVIVLERQSDMYVILIPDNRIQRLTGLLYYHFTSQTHLVRYPDTGRILLPNLGVLAKW